MIDLKGFRSNVAIVLANKDNKLFWAKRIQQKNSWQFPQGGINEGEKPRQALYRELWEEIGLRPKDVQILGETKRWLSYKIPQHLIRKATPKCIGQKQKWFLLRLQTSDDQIKLDASNKPEFKDWMWVSYWYPLNSIIQFKREVYRKGLRELAPFLFLNNGRSKILDNLT